MEINKERYIDRIIEDAISKNRIPGAQIGIYQGKRVLLEKSYGDARETIYRIYSMTKPMTATAVMLLYERGMLDLLEPVSDYLPEFKDMKIWTSKGLIPAKNPIRIKELLNMTSGICYPDEDVPGQYMQAVFDDIQAKVETEEAYTTREVVKKIAEQPLTFEPGTAWRYGLSADVLGALVEVVTGSSFRDFIIDNICKPLEMVDTDFYVPEEKQHRLTELYTLEEKEDKCFLKVEKKRHLGLSYGNRIPAFISGGAGLFTTLEDYSKFARMLALGGEFNGVRLLSERTVKMFTKDNMEGVDKSRFLPQMEGYGYGNLMRVLNSPRACSNGTEGEFGWDGWTGPYCSIDCHDGLVFLTMIQVTAFGDWSMNRKLKAVANSMLV